MKGFRTGLKHLRESCPHMRRAFDVCGQPKSRKRAPGFATLIRIIVDQQVSVHAGAAIWGRLEGALGTVTPEATIRAGDKLLRNAGLSGSKTRYVLGIANEIEAGHLNLERLARRPDDHVREALTALTGIGPWTADIYLMFALGRPDVWPVGDIALQAAAGRILGFDERPSAKLLDEIGERWRPYRSVAAVSLWHFYKRMPAE